jgi:hypothetical protein
LLLGLLLGGRVEEAGDLLEVLLGEGLLLAALGVALGDLDGLLLVEGVGLAPADPGAVGADVPAELDPLDLEEVGDLLPGVALGLSGGGYGNPSLGILLSSSYLEGETLFFRESFPLYLGEILIGKVDLFPKEISKPRLILSSRDRGIP